MGKILRLIFTGKLHDHEWETINTQDYSRTYYGTAYSRGTLYTLKCKICGDIRERKIEV